MNINYFNILDMEENFSIDKEKLEDNYLSSQKKFHPDNAKDNKQKLDFLKISSDINAAYKNLKNDYLRAVYILGKYGINLTDESYNKTNSLSTVFLQEIFERRQQIEEIEGFDNLNNLLENEKIVRKDIINKIDELFKISDYKKAAIEVQKLKYQDNIINRIEEKIEKCF